MIIHNPILTGSFTVNGTDVSSITSSAASLTSLNAYTASQNILNGTYATTGSNTFAGIQTVNSNLIVTGSITAQTLVVQTITSSVDFVTGSTRFGSVIGNTHQFTGSVGISGSLTGIEATFASSVGINGGDFRYRPNGDVTNSPALVFKDAGNSALDICAEVIGDANVSSRPIAFRVSNPDRGRFEAMRITSGGNVGIGINTPLSRLDVRTTSAANGDYQTIQAFSTNSAGINLGGGISLGGFYNGTVDIAQFASIWGRKENGTAGNYDGYLAFGTNSQATGVRELMRITSGGDIFIGITTNDIGKLQIQASGTGLSYAHSLLLKDNSTYKNALLISHRDGDTRLMSTWSGSGINSNMTFWTTTSAGSQSERMRIQSNGVVKIGNGVNPDDGQNPGYGNVSISFHTGENTGMIQALQQNINVYTLRLNPSGGQVFAGSSRLDNISDIRMKTDITSLGETLEIINQLQPKKFHLIDEKNGKLRYGFIAQELEGILDEFVYNSNIKYKDDETGYEIENVKGIENWASSWAALLVKGIQEQQTQIQELKAEIDELKNK
jgi:hypothetical protein